MTLTQLYSHLRRRLQRKYSADQAGWVARRLLERFVGSSPLFEPDRRVPMALVQAVEKAFHRLDAGEPLQYVLGEWEFLGLRMEVTPDVLIPRPETEYLVRGAFEMCPRPPRVVWDVGTGSGCIAVAVKKQWPSAQVYAFEKSPPALAVAQRNALRHGVDIHWVEGDFLQMDLSAWPVPDLLISNPPYLERGVDEVAPDVARYEPADALYPPADPLIFYRKMAEYVCRRPTVAVALEVNPRFRESILRLFGRPPVEPSPLWHSAYCLWLPPDTGEA